MKTIAVRYPLSDWKLIQRAAAEAGKTMTAWLLNAAEAELEKLRQNAARTEP